MANGGKLNSGISRLNPVRNTKIMKTVLGVCVGDFDREKATGQGTILKN